LIEMILVVAISSIIALAVSQIFLSGTKSFEKNKEMQKDLEAGRSAMELMTKNIRMSRLTTANSDSTILYTYNNSQSICISYKFDNTNHKLQSAFRAPDLTDPNNPTCSLNSSAYTYVDLIANNITGNFSVPFQTNRTTPPYSIGRVSIRMTTGEGTDYEKTLQTSVSFRDYDGILQ